APGLRVDEDHAGGNTAELVADELAREVRGRQLGLLEKVDTHDDMIATKAILGVGVGGSHVKVLVSSDDGERGRVESGPELTPSAMVQQLLELTADWRYDVVSIGVPAPVREGQIVSDPVNLGKGWVGYDFAAAFGRPTKVVNDAAMQALGSYEGGKM